MSASIASGTAESAGSAKVVGAVAVAAGLVALQVLRPVGLAGDLSYLIVVVSASVLSVLAARRLTTERFAWWLVASGLSMSALGDVGFYMLSWTGKVPDGLSWCDPFWLTGSVLMLGGIVRLVAGRSDSLNPDRLIDAASLAVIIGFCAWPLLIAPILDDATLDLPTRAVTAAYPLLDVVMLTLLMRAVLHGGRSRRAHVLGLGLAGWLAADLASSAAFKIGQNGYDRWMNAGWMISSVVMAVALGLPERASNGPEPGDDWLEPGQVGSAIVPLLVPAFVFAVGEPFGVAPSPLALFGVMVVLTCLVLLRVSRLAVDRAESRRQLADNERFYRALAATSSDAVVVVDRARRIVHGSPTLDRLLRRAPSEHVGSDVVEVIVPIDGAPLFELFNRSASMPWEPLTVDVDIVRGDGSECCYEVRVINLLGHPAVRGIVVTLHDATDRRAAAAELSRRALHDPLTGLANRTLLRDRLEQAFRRSGRTGIDPALLYLDVDGFKQVNDRLGHECGDEVLVALSERIQATTRSEDTVARLGGDEFAILIEGTPAAAGFASATASRVLASLVEPIRVGSLKISLSGSIGIDVGEPGTDAATVLRNADIAMYRAKATGKGKWVRFDPSMQSSTRD